MYINGENGPPIKTEPGLVTDGLKIKVELDFGGGVVDHRGALTGAGA